MTARPDSRTVDPASLDLDDDTRGALERVSLAVWRALLAADEAERRQAVQRADQRLPDKEA